MTSISQDLPGKGKKRKGWKNFIGESIQNKPGVKWKKHAIYITFS